SDFRFRICQILHDTLLRRPPKKGLAVNICSTVFSIRNSKSAIRNRACLGDTHENRERNGYEYRFVSPLAQVRMSRGCYRSSCQAKRLNGGSKVQPPHSGEPAGVQGTNCPQYPGKW